MVLQGVGLVWGGFITVAIIVWLGICRTRMLLRMMTLIIGLDLYV